MKRIKVLKITYKDSEKVIDFKKKINTLYDKKGVKGCFSKNDFVKSD